VTHICVIGGLSVNQKEKKKGLQGKRVGVNIGKMKQKHKENVKTKGHKKISKIKK